jgi:peptidoglycan/LPS O-acetylase OafA/YrhL
MPNKMIDALTGLRFVAAMLVVLHHYPVPGAVGPAATVFKAGYCGVTFFFVLSGFVLGYNYLDEFRQNPSRAVAPYLVARIARIYPVYALILVYMWLSLGAQQSIVPLLLTTQVWSGDFFVAFGVVGPGWSIGVEMFLYLCFPLLIIVMQALRIFDRLDRLAIAAALAATGMVALAVYFDVSGRGALSPYDPASAHRWLYRLPLTRLGDFVLGILAAAFCMHLRGVPTPNARFYAALAWISAAFALTMMATPANLNSAYSWDVLYALPSVMMIVGVVNSPAAPLSRWLSTRTAVQLGEISYCLYLLHVPLGALNKDIAGGYPAQLVFYVIFLFFVLAMSYGLHYTFERPAQRWIKARFAGHGLATARDRAVGPQS